MNMNKNISKRLIVCLSLAIYISSFFMPALGEYKGITIFSMGIVLLTFYAGIPGFFVGLFWFANVFYVVGIIGCLRKKEASVLWLATAFITGILFLFLSLLNILMVHSEQPKGIDAFKVGFWCWLISFLIIPVFTLFKVKPE